MLIFGLGVAQIQGVNVQVLSHCEERLGQLHAALVRVTITLIMTSQDLEL